MKRVIAMWSVFGAACAVATVADPSEWVPEGILPPLPEDGPALCVRDYLTPEEGAAVLDAALAAFPDRKAWEAYAARVRTAILEGAGLVPWPRQSPLQAVIRDRREYDGYSVENVAFESIPGYWVTGSLYRPLGRTGPFPAILNPHGHSAMPTEPGDWIKHGRFKADVQLRAAAQARMGAVALTIDMFGYGDSMVFLGPDAHRTPVALTMQLLNARRALDFLQALDGVDSSRMAVTGHSGGATQAFLLSAIDERVKVCVPVAMVSSYFFGGCPCESGLPVHRSADHFASNAMISALTAPRPMLLVSDGGDWTQFTPETEYPFLRTIYGYFGAEDRIANVHLPNEGHNYGPSKRAASYPFLALHLGLDLKAVQGPGGAIDESRLTVEDPARMRALQPGEARLKNALTSAEAVLAALRRLQR